MKYMVTVVLDCPSYWNKADVRTFMKKHCTPSELATLQIREETTPDEATGQVETKTPTPTPVTQKVLDK